MPTSILNIFAQSPFTPMQKHMEKSCSCALVLKELVSEVYKSDWTGVNQKYAEILELESEADSLKRSIRLHLPNNLFMPTSRGDLLELLTKQDAIANTAKDISGLIIGRKMQFPVSIQARYQELLKRSLDATLQAKKAIDELDELLETGFRGVEADLVKNMIIEIDDTEEETDEIQIDVRSQVFAIESEISPVDTMFLYKIIDLTGSIADYAQQVGHRLQLLLAK
jgi:uncharacterized protein